MNKFDALQRVNYMKLESGERVPVLRACSDCKSWLDVESGLVASIRPAITYVLSSGLCHKCKEKCQKKYGEGSEVEKLFGTLFKAPSND